MVQGAIPALVGAFFWYKNRHVAASVLFGISGVLLVTGFLLPSVFLRIEKLGQGLGRIVGVVLTWLCLVPAFFLVFVPGHLILKIRGLDPLSRAFPTDLPSYWVPRKPVASTDDYKRQY